MPEKHLALGAVAGGADALKTEQPAEQYPAVEKCHAGHAPVDGRKRHEFRELSGNFDWVKGRKPDEEGTF